MKYDPSGLRSSMSATWGALEKAVDEKATPNHLPKPAWWNELDAIEAECEKKGIPYLMGRRWGKNGTGNYNEIRW
jgi:hypothetical protein